MTERLREALRFQAEACADLGSPFMQRLCSLLSERLEPGTPLTDRLFGWQGDLGPRGDSVPLRLAGALHALKLQGHTGLAQVYPPHRPDDEALWNEVSNALASEAAFIDRWIDSPPQTNEVRRAACLIAVGHLLDARFGLPLSIMELGASAGLNLNWDRFALEAGGQRFGPKDAVLTLRPDWRGPLHLPATPKVSERAGVDLNPIDARSEMGRLRLLAYLWPDQPERIALTEAAIGAVEAPPVKGDAIDWLTMRLAPKPGQTRLIYSTITWQYFPRAAQERGERLIREAGANATLESPLAWFGMETDGQSPGAAMTLHLWPPGETLALGRIDFHGRWIDWAGPV
jgi:hypothetical protein